jgi:hypothetical protein
MAGADIRTYIPHATLATAAAKASSSIKVYTAVVVGLL